VQVKARREVIGPFRRRTATYSALASDVTQAGAEYLAGAGAVDPLMVSARARPAHPSWMRTFMDILRATVPATCG
jgi:protease I